MTRIIKINEQQYNRIMLGEELHYPKFLDTLKNEISAKVHLRIEEELSNGHNHFSFAIPLNCEYTDRLFINVNVSDNNNVSDKKAYKCYYYNEYNALIDDKLINPQIYIQCPSANNKVMFPILKTVLSHEITHLYDDWSELKRNSNGINYVSKNCDTATFVNSSFHMDDNLYKALSMMAYMSLKVERQAFLSQTIQELEELGCTLSNYHKKLKETIIYNNLTKSYELLLNEINNANEHELNNCNTYIIYTHPKANLPKMNVGNFNATKYKAKLLQWAEKEYHNLMKMYASIVQYYIDQLKERQEELNDAFIF